MRRGVGIAEAGEWSREDLAEATGAPVDALAEYEDGRRPLTREVLADMIAGLHPTEEDALALCSSIPRARPWIQAGPGLSEQEKDMLRRLDWRAMIHYGVIFFMLEKLGAVVGTIAARTIASAGRSLCQRRRALSIRSSPK